MRMTQAYLVTFLDKQNQPLFTREMEFPDWWTACDTLLGAMPEGAEEFDVTDLDGNIPAF
jgi:hypothetical protein